ncbi:potassium channel subfamily K member 12 isoform X1 [Oenanthe melanoleuca]|uniref:potassium channel subfamily K member 12 isoform X1 n=2 Tax=Oenanthe melanoleuca TaxID=2939378 RepID=UPI0024C103C0|nr:potassium channel subfamily K member 12 isoform X1 [Oenanthe melanoleuca]XP_056344416.1 potassium channel subfamily K member 12 isoform X1 [Oenanthe melanoleuca]
MMPPRGAVGSCRRRRLAPLNEDNGRFLLLAALIAAYLSAGATVFSALESPSEAAAQLRWNRTLHNFSRIFNISLPELRAFLRSYEAAMAAGIRVDALRPRWDFPGAFYFVGTVVSTIGFGMTTPATVAGKLFLIIYGLFGCAGTILFFNLFLERIISLLAFIMRACYERQLQRSGLLPPNFRRGSAVSGVGSLVGWKPSVYHVMLILGIFAVTLSCCASAMYTAVEGWNYVDSLYYCFVTFSTIGFGDLVSNQKATYQHQGLYRFGNFMFILLGVCCIYSLFNVISIVIKQILNWALKKLECRCCPKCHKSSSRLSRRNAITPGARLRRHNAAAEAEGQYDSDTEGRRLSGEMISMRELTASSKVSLAILQKQLSETANGYPRNVCINTRQNGFSAGVGALAIMNNRLAETSDSRQSRYQQYLDTD